MDRIRETVLDLLANELFQAGRRIQEDVDWEQVFQECRRQTVTVHGWNQVCNMDFLPEAVRKDWGQAAVGDAFIICRFPGSTGRWAEVWKRPGFLT